ncbi:MAG: hypothetical protein M1837_007416 [Sclerophora amabilis]|nr:MAG: hypothetical protein M1837_007416 [Sclerophora amabilis]
MGDEQLESALPKCIASTTTTYPSTLTGYQRRGLCEHGSPVSPVVDSQASPYGQSNFFKNAQWYFIHPRLVLKTVTLPGLCLDRWLTGPERSNDGTTILTSSEDNILRTFVLPPNLLEESPNPHELEPYSTSSSPEPIYASCIYPHFNLQDPRTTIYLSSPRDHPIALCSSIPPPDGTHSPILASYPLVHAPTEAYLTPHSLLFTTAGTHFLAGSDSLISLFDLSRTGEAPVTQLPTIPSKRKKLVGGGVGMKGIISAMATTPDTAGTASTLLASGTFTRSVGLYDAEGSGSCVAVFSIVEDQRRNSTRKLGAGGGITQLQWSACSRYLFVAERRSDAVLVYDIRVAGKKLGALWGRFARTNQRLGISVARTETGGDEVWAGGLDGVIRVWDHATELEGDRESATWQSGSIYAGPSIRYSSRDLFRTEEDDPSCSPFISVIMFIIVFVFIDFLRLKRQLVDERGGQLLSIFDEFIRGSRGISV